MLYVASICRTSPYAAYVCCCWDVRTNSTLNSLASFVSRVNVAECCVISSQMLAAMLLPFSDRYRSRLCRSLTWTGCPSLCNTAVDVSAQTALRIHWHRLFREWRNAASLVHRCWRHFSLHDCTGLTRTGCPSFCNTCATEVALPFTLNRQSS